jgi:glycosyltransferase involved in cell wall biosynthesis
LTAAVRELVVCSLEAWDDIWRRNQFLTAELLNGDPELRVLFVEPPSDVLYDLSQGKRPVAPQLRRERDRLHALRPLKILPRRVGGASDRYLRRQVLKAAAKIGFRRPLLWVNDVTYAPLLGETGWPGVYDVTDDWLLAPFSQRELARLRALDRLALAASREVIVCSPGLAASRGREREVTLIPNGVDVGHFRRPQPRPSDLPPSPVAVYVGSLHDARLDVDLVGELARAAPELSIAFVGPDSLQPESRRQLESQPNVHLLGPRPYAIVPAYLQHADVVIVPHRVSPFTDSLDPIKAYECLAVGRPAVATPVAGFRELTDVVTVAPADRFTSAVKSTLAAVAPTPPRANGKIREWKESAAAFAVVLERAASG